MCQCAVPVVLLISIGFPRRKLRAVGVRECKNRWDRSKNFVIKELILQAKLPIVQREKSNRIQVSKKNSLTLQNLLSTTRNTICSKSKSLRMRTSTSISQVKERTREKPRERVSRSCRGPIRTVHPSYLENCQWSTAKSNLLCPSRISRHTNKLQQARTR